MNDFFSLTIRDVYSQMHQSPELCASILFDVVVAEKDAVERKRKLSTCESLISTMGRELASWRDYLFSGKCAQNAVQVTQMLRERVSKFENATALHCQIVQITVVVQPVLQIIPELVPIIDSYLDDFDALPEMLRAFHFNLGEEKKALLALANEYEIDSHKVNACKSDSLEKEVENLYAMTRKVSEVSEDTATLIKICATINGGSQFQTALIGKKSHHLVVMQRITAWLKQHCCRELNLKGLGMRRLPEVFYSFDSLTKVDIRDNQITVLKDVSRWTKLEFFFASNNRLTALPSGIHNWICIRYVDLANNALTHLPAEISKWEALSFLNVHHNFLRIIPSVVGDFNLGHFDASDNQLEVLPIDIRDWRDITHFDVSRNRLKSFPNVILDWSRKNSTLKFNVTGNHLGKLDIDFGLDSTVTYIGGNPCNLVVYRSS